jgi:hypothetical protein
MTRAAAPRVLRPTILRFPAGRKTRFIPLFYRRATQFGSTMLSGSQGQSPVSDSRLV